VIDPVDPYYYSPAYCVGCWYANGAGASATPGRGRRGSAGTSRPITTDAIMGATSGTKASVRLIY